MQHALEDVTGLVKTLQKKANVLSVSAVRSYKLTDITGHPRRLNNVAQEFNDFFKKKQGNLFVPPYGFTCLPGKVAALQPNAPPEKIYEPRPVHILFFCTCFRIFAMRILR